MENNTLDMNHVKITKSQLISDYNECMTCQTNGYSFIRVLSAKEKQRFIDRMEDNMLLYCYKNRSIKTFNWIQILENILLETEYHIYRKSYWGENGGSKKATTLKTNTMTLVYIITGIKDNNLHKVKKTRVNLLLENNHLKIIDKINPSSWSNDKYLLDNTEDEIM
jgi:hypothetical protein